jgi:hypothetical protein
MGDHDIADRKTFCHSGIKTDDLIGFLHQPDRKAGGQGVGMPGEEEPEPGAQKPEQQCKQDFIVTVSMNNCSPACIYISEKTPEAYLRTIDPIPEHPGFGIPVHYRNDGFHTSRDSRFV